MAATADITPRQARYVHVLLGQVGISDDEYREILRRDFGADTCKDLSRAQAAQLISDLVALTRPRPAPPRPRRGVTTLATARQRQLLVDLVSEIEWRLDDGYERWLKANQSLEAVRTSAEAARVIRGLLAIKHSKVT